MKLRNLFIALFTSMVLAANAGKVPTDSKYLLGAVPEVNGLVTFTKTFSVEGKSTAQLHDALANWTKQLVEKSIPAPGKFARVMADEQDSIVARACEWLVFKKKALNLDRARLRYQLKAIVNGNTVTLTVTQLTYYYGEDEDFTKNVIFKAEEWITDKEAVNKAGTKLYPKSGKFRCKTIDRMEELFKSAEEACK